MVFTTERLLVRKLELSDAPFIQKLVNEPGWLEYIGDRKVHTIEDAKNYIREGPQVMYETYGFGLLLIQDRFNNSSFGLSGLIQRDHLDAPDLGFALLGSSERKGYAFEASDAILHHEFVNNKREKIWAFTKLGNQRSQKLLGKLNFEECINKEHQDSSDRLYVNNGNMYR